MCDKHYGDWMHIWNELTQTAGHQLGYANMVGNIPGLVNPNENASNSVDKTVAGEILYIPLEFWFCRNPGLALPLIAYIVGQKSALPSPVTRAQGWENKLVAHIHSRSIEWKTTSTSTRMYNPKYMQCNKTKLLETLKSRSIKGHKSLMKNNDIDTHNMKQCSKCKEIRALECFGKLASTKDGLRYDCKVCRALYNKQNKTAKVEYNRQYYAANKEAVLKANAEYRETHRDEINRQRSEYRSRDAIKAHVRQKNREYLPVKKQAIKARRASDKNFQLAEILRSKVHKMIKGHETSYMTLIGCEVDVLKSWLEFQFEDGMTWDNLGSHWQIDHILPIAAFDFTKDQDKRVCFSWTNLQPLTSVENRKKSDTLMLHYYYNSIVSIHRFIQLHKSNFIGYQSIRESLCWLREKLRYGENPTDTTIGNQQPSSYSRYDKAMEKVQRLDGFGSERSYQPP